MSHVEITTQYLRLTLRFIVMLDSKPNDVFLHSMTVPTTELETLVEETLIAARDVVTPSQTETKSISN